MLFAESDRIRTALVQAILDAPDVTEPLQVITTILAEFDWSGLGIALQRRRHAVIAANPGLLERDLIKQNDIAGEFIQALRKRGVEESTARLAARVGIQVFAAAYAEWVERDDRRRPRGNSPTLQWLSSDFSCRPIERLQGP